MNREKFKAICARAIVAAVATSGTIGPGHPNCFGPGNHRDSTICLFCRRSTFPGRNVSVHLLISVVSLHPECEGRRGEVLYGKS